EGYLIEAVDDGIETLEMLLLAAGGDGGKGAAVERALDGDDAIALWRAVLVVILAGHLEAAFDGLGAGIAEEHSVGKARRHEPLGQTLLARDLVQIRQMPDLPDLFGQRLHQVGMRVAKRRDGNAAGEIEIPSPIRGEEVGALAPLERDL